MSLGSMSHVDFKKWPCRRVEFKGQDPLEGEGGGGPQCCMLILRNDHITYLIAYFPQCYMSNLRKGYIPGFLSMRFLSMSFCPK